MVLVCPAGASFRAARTAWNSASDCGSTSAGGRGGETAGDPGSLARQLLLLPLVGVCGGSGARPLLVVLVLALAATGSAAVSLSA